MLFTKITKLKDMKNGQEKYCIRLYDITTNKKPFECTWKGSSEAVRKGAKLTKAYSEAVAVGVIVESAYALGLKDGEKKALKRTVDMVQQLGGKKV